MTKFVTMLVFLSASVALAAPPTATPAKAEKKPAPLVQPTPADAKAIAEAAAALKSRLHGKIEDINNEARKVAAEIDAELAFGRKIAIAKQEIELLAADLLEDELLAQEKAAERKKVSERLDKDLARIKDTASADNVDRLSLEAVRTAKTLLIALKKEEDLLAADSAEMQKELAALRLEHALLLEKRRAGERTGLIERPGRKTRTARKPTETKPTTTPAGPPESLTDALKSIEPLRK